MEGLSLVSRELPPGLEALAELARDLRWTWSHAGDALWRRVDAQLWERTRNPYVILQNVSRTRLIELSKDRGFRAQLQRVVVERERYASGRTWYGQKYAEKQIRGIAYFSMEFGLGQALPLYAGGLGILAGDYLKIASDLGVPLVGVGLLYQEGYFRQMLDADGWQQEAYPYNDPSTLPVEPVYTESGAWLYVSAHFPGRDVRFRVWSAKVGRVALYLLDSNDPLNTPADRGITSKLYGGGEELRFAQEVALGICGWRLIEALGLDIDVCHLNEGHAAFVTLERARHFMDAQNVDFWEGLWATRPGNVFTTHTPVASGFDAFAVDLMLKYGGVFAAQVGVAPDELGALGRRDPGNLSEPFSMAYLAIRTCGSSNGVSKRHGEVSRALFQPLYERRPQWEVPIRHITNGVHVSSWDSTWADEVWTRACGQGRWHGGFDDLAEAGAVVEKLLRRLSDEELWAFRCRERADLVKYVRERLASQLAQRGAPASVVSTAETALDPHALTLGLARRFVEYKRPNLLLHDPQRLLRLLSDSQRPVQLIVAGKAHPSDDVGKRLIQEWIQFVQRPDVRAHAVFLEDYDIALAQKLVHGVDVWINTPRCPSEACGTSGMKVLANGGLNVSELDGWWAEAFSDGVGWALGDGREHREPDWDSKEAVQLYDLLEKEIVPAFHARDSAGLPRAWIGRVRASMAGLTVRFSANRMMREYVERSYLAAAAAVRRRSARGGKLAKELRRWEQALRRHWHEIHWGSLTVHEHADGWSFDVQLYLGEVPPDFVEVELYADPASPETASVTAMSRGDAIPGEVGGYTYSCRLVTRRAAADFSPRVVPFQPEARIPEELALTLWWQGRRGVAE